MYEKTKVLFSDIIVYKKKHTETILSVLSVDCGWHIIHAQ